MKVARLLSLLAPLLLCNCDDGHLRGSASPSKDGKTYLAVVDNNGGKCGPLLVDGQAWNFKIGEPGPIAPGVHTIDCGGTIEFEVPAGVVFSFDYWGP